MTALADHLVSVLHALSVRASREEKPNLGPAVSLMGDLGRVVSRAQPDDLRAIHTAVAALRERLDTAESGNGPVAALEGPDSQAFLAGAMWAVSELVTARLDALDAVESMPGRRARKHQVEDAIFGELSAHGTLSGIQISSSPAGEKLELKKYEVSRALAQMLADGYVQEVPSAADTDRRHRYWALTDLGERASEQRAKRGLSRWLGR